MVRGEGPRIGTTYLVILSEAKDLCNSSADSSVELPSKPLRWRLTVGRTLTVALVESFLVGTWLSLVEHSLGVRGVGSSNLPVPTILHFRMLEDQLERLTAGFEPEPFHVRPVA